jgi:translation initiation factor 2B subunit (eIF-2B alpha/beta/delta family)
MFETGQQQAGNVVQQFMSGFKERAKNLVQYLGTFVSFYEVIDVIKKGVSVVSDFDTALTEMRKVSDYSVGTLTDF